MCSCCGCYDCFEYFQSLWKLDKYKYLKTNKNEQMYCHHMFRMVIQALFGYDKWFGRMGHLQQEYKTN